MALRLQLSLDLPFSRGLCSYSSGFSQFWDVHIERQVSGAKQTWRVASNGRFFPPRTGQGAKSPAEVKFCKLRIGGLRRSALVIGSFERPTYSSAFTLASSACRRLAQLPNSGWAL